jgi:hypothetical protein
MGWQIDYWLGNTFTRMKPSIMTSRKMVTDRESQFSLSESREVRSQINPRASTGE